MIIYIVVHNIQTFILLFMNIFVGITEMNSILNTIDFF